MRCRATQRPSSNLPSKCLTGTRQCPVRALNFANAKKPFSHRLSYASKASPVRSSCCVSSAGKIRLPCSSIDPSARVESPSDAELKDTSVSSAYRSVICQMAHFGADASNPLRDARQCLTPLPNTGCIVRLCADKSLTDAGHVCSLVGDDPARLDGPEFPSGTIRPANWQYRPTHLQFTCNFAKIRDVCRSAFCWERNRLLSIFSSSIIAASYAHSTV